MTIHIEPEIGMVEDGSAVNKQSVSFLHGIAISVFGILITWLLTIGGVGVYPIDDYVLAEGDGETTDFSLSNLETPYGRCQGYVELPEVTIEEHDGTTSHINYGNFIQCGETSSFYFGKWVNVTYSEDGTSISAYTEEPLSEGENVEFWYDAKPLGGSRIIPMLLTMVPLFALVGSFIYGIVKQVKGEGYQGFLLGMTVGVFIAFALMLFISFISLRLFGAPGITEGLIS